MTFAIVLVVTWLVLSLVVAVGVGSAISEAEHREHRTPCGPVVPTSPAIATLSPRVTRTRRRVMGCR